MAKNAVGLQRDRAYRYSMTINHSVPKNKTSRNKNNKITYSEKIYNSLESTTKRIIENPRDPEPEERT